jgi:hypothetical protein
MADSDSNSNSNSVASVHRLPDFRPRLPLGEFSAQLSEEYIASIIRVVLRLFLLASCLGYYSQCKLTVACSSEIPDLLACTRC